MDYQRFFAIKNLHDDWEVQFYRDGRIVARRRTQPIVEASVQAADRDQLQFSIYWLDPIDNPKFRKAIAADVKRLFDKLLGRDGSTFH